MMMKFFKSLFAVGGLANARQKAGTERVVRSRAIKGSPLTQMENMDELGRAERQVVAAERLLLNPTPESVRDTRILLEEAMALVERFTRGKSAHESLAGDQRLRIQQFVLLCQRVRKLLEGALRVQWVRMHSIAAITQTYTRGAKTKTWNPISRTLNLEM